MIKWKRRVQTLRAEEVTLFEYIDNNFLPKISPSFKMEMLGLYSNRPRGDILYIFKIIFTFLQNNFWNPCYPYINITSLYLYI